MRIVERVNGVVICVSYMSDADLPPEAYCHNGDSDCGELHFVARMPGQIDGLLLFWCPACCRPTVINPWADDEKFQRWIETFK